jgi:hypothetical protein
MLKATGIDGLAEGVTNAEEVVDRAARHRKTMASTHLESFAQL